MEVSVYTGITKTSTPVSAYVYSIDLFEDTDGDLLPTGNDFPQDPGADTLRIENGIRSKRI